MRRITRAFVHYPAILKVGIFSALFGLSVLPHASTHASGEKVPVSHKQAIDVLKKHRVWQSIAITSMGELQFPGVSKKWEVYESSSELRLQERTQMSIAEDGKWKSESLIINEDPISCMTFTNMPFPVNAFFKVLPGDKLLLSYDMGFRFDVILIPSAARQERRTPLLNIGVIEAPAISSAGPPIAALPDIDYSNGFLHHPQGRVVRVVLDKNFPKRFEPAILRVLKKWNLAIGFELYRESLERKKVDGIECLTEAMLCLKWTGPTDALSWVGWGGIAANAFDPENGAIIGAVVVLQNLRSVDSLSETPKDVIARYLTRDLSLDFFASLMLRKEEFKNYRHPFEESLVENLLVHEIGHTNGLRHDFSASTEANLENVSDSIMDYLPFPIAPLNTELGKRDLERLAVVYGRSSRAIYYDGCSDSMEQAGAEVNCMKGDWGAPELWYRSIVERAPTGLYTAVVEYMSELPIRQYLDIFAKFFVGTLTRDSQTKEVEEFLCSHPSKERVTKDLAERHELKICLKN